MPDGAAMEEGERGERVDAESPTLIGRPDPAGARLSRAIAMGLWVLLGVLLVEVLFEGWLTTVLGTKHTDAGRAVVDPATWPKTLKSALYLAILALTGAKLTLDRRWGILRTKADVGLAVVGITMLAAAGYGGSSAVLAGEALFVYFRGAIVFYALRALNPSPRLVRPLVWLVGSLIAVDAAIALWQQVVGYPSYRALGWVDMTWARIDRAHALLLHPNDLGHVTGLFLLGLLAYFAVRPRVARGWWLLFCLIAIGLAATQSRESLIGVLAGGALIAVMRRGRYRRIALALGLVVVIAAAPLAFSPSNRAEWNRRLAGLIHAFEVPSGAEPEQSSAPGASRGSGECAPSDTGCQADENSKKGREIRVLYYQQGLRLWAHRPLFGYGLGTFGGIVAFRNNPDWNTDPRFGPGGFNKYGFNAKTVDSFWLHLLVETGALGLAAYLCWIYVLAAPFLRIARRHRGPPARAADPFVYWAPAALVFAVLIAFLSPSLEDPLFPPLLFSILGIAWLRLMHGDTMPPAATAAAAAGEASDTHPNPRPHSRTASTSVTGGQEA